VISQELEILYARPRAAFFKKTVNFDDPSTYHFYLGDKTGHPAPS